MDNLKETTLLESKAYQYLMSRMIEEFKKMLESFSEDCESKNIFYSYIDTDGAIDSIKDITKQYEQINEKLVRVLEMNRENEIFHNVDDVIKFLKILIDAISIY